MAIFGVLELEDTLQVNDKTRLNATKSYITKNEAAVTLVRIKPEASAAFIQVSGANLTAKDWFLDWQYESAGSKLVTLEITTNSLPVIFTKTISVLSEADDKLFSNDSDLIKHQHDILNYIPAGKSSWKFVHRRAQDLILAYLDEQGRVNKDESKITKDQIIDLSEVKELSIYTTLRLIFESISNSPDDFFMKKAKHWEVYELKAKQRAWTRIDFDKDGDLDQDNPIDNYTIKAGRR